MGEIENEAGAFSIKIPSSFNEPKDVYNLPVKVNGNRVIENNKSSFGIKSLS